MTDELAQLVADYCEGIASPQQMDRLSELLRESPAARQYLLDILEMDGQLRWEFGPPPGQTNSDAESDARPMPKRQGKRSPCDAPDQSPLTRVYCFFAQPKPLSLSVAALVMLSIITAMAFMAAPFYRAVVRTESDETPSGQYAIVAEVTDLRDVKWADDNVIAHRGAFLVAGRKLHFEAGRIEISYRSGARVVLEGPAEYEVLDANSGQLQQGRLVAKVEQESAKGFAIATPLARVIDLGTEFGVEVPSQQIVEIHCFAGSVVVERDRANVEPVVLSADEAMRITGNGAVIEYPAVDQKRFARTIHPDVDPITPDSVAGLVGWYDAQQLAGPDDTSVTSWSDTAGGSNVVADDLTHVQAADPKYPDAKAVAPTLQSVSLNGGMFRCVRFAKHEKSGEFDLLQARDLVTNGDTSRTMIFVLRGGIDSDWSRPGGFGSVMSGFDSGLSGAGPHAVNWNLAMDGNGSLRFDGALIVGQAPGLSRSRFLIRTAVMNSSTSFDEYLSVLNGKFNERQVLRSGSPSMELNSTVADFFVGDVYEGQRGGMVGNSRFDILEVLVFDEALSSANRRGIHAFLIEKYTSRQP